jgi:hypothetical protein
VLDLKQKIEAAQALKQFGFEATKSKRSLSLTQLFELFVKESGIKREPSTIKVILFPRILSAGISNSL